MSRRNPNPTRHAPPNPTRSGSLPLLDGNPPAAVAVDSRQPGDCLDVLGDIMQRLAALRLPVGVLDLAQLEESVRADWGGERAYIRRTGEASDREMAQRDIAIRSQHRRGERVELLSRRWGLSARRIQQIISG